MNYWPESFTGKGFEQMEGRKGEKHSSLIVNSGGKDGEMRKKP
jgi:hypothetical protein